MSLQTQHDPKNEAEIAYWNSAGGRRWVERQQSQDIVLDPILQARRACCRYRLRYRCELDRARRARWPFRAGAKRTAREFQKGPNESAN